MPLLLTDRRRIRVKKTSCPHAWNILYCLEGTVFLISDLYFNYYMYALLYYKFWSALMIRQIVA
ncbi:hypothetical protein JXQ70_20550 [bacterium]|nr:hypothetical protein [bacterium]